MLRRVGVTALAVSSRRAPTATTLAVASSALATSSFRYGLVVSNKEAAAAETSTVPATTTISSSTPSVTSASAMTSKKKKATVITATTLHAGDAPKVVEIDLSSAHDETVVPRLAQYHEPKPFVTPKQVRDFSFSLAVGALVIAGVHYVISSSIAENYEEEVAILRRVARDTTKVEKLPPKPEVPQFVAPSSYSSLKKKMDEETRIARELYMDNKNKKETPVLHQEFTQRVMLGWNNALSNVEASAAAMAVQYQNWRLKQMQKKLKALLAQQNLELVEFREVQ